MPLPASVTTVAVHGKIVSPNGGTAASGFVRFGMPYPLRAAADDTIIGPVTLVAELDVDGEFTIDLPATDDPDVTPSSWTYDVRVETSAWRERLSVEIPVASAGTGLEFADLVPAITPPTLVSYATAAALIAHAADTTVVHGITDTAALLTDGDLAGYAELTGATFAGDVLVDGARAAVAGDPGTFRQLQLASGVVDPDDVRWSIQADNSAEAGGNAGSTFKIVRYSDLGVALDAPITIDRATGRATVIAQFEVDGANFIVSGTNKGYRFRPLGDRLDCEATGSDWQLSVFSGTNYDGTQRNYLRFESGTQLAHAIGKWIFAETPDDAAVHTIDGTGDGQLGFFGAAGSGQKTVTGSRAGNAALASLLGELEAYGLIVDGTTA